MQIEIDFDVYKTLTGMRENEGITYNDILRRLLKLPSKTTVVPSPSPQQGRSFSSQGVELPHGTDCRLKHKGQWCYGKISDGELVVDGKRYTSVSAPACVITGTSVNGWKYWEVRFPGQAEWQAIDTLRNRQGNRF